MPRPVHLESWPRVHRRTMLLAIAVAAALLGGAAPALGHGPDPGPPTVSLLWTGWSFDPLVWVPVVLALWLYRTAYGRVAREHPENPVRRYRWWSWATGLVVLVLALQSPIERYDTTLFSVHMVQHLLIVMVAEIGRAHV